MFCPSCGKNVPESSSFCLHCGSSITNPKAASDKQIEWEYCDYIVEYKSGEGGKYPLTIGENENTIRLAVWNSDQLIRLSDIQKWLDKGWQSVSQIGPSGYSFRQGGGGFLGGTPYLTVVEFRVKMRRPKHVS